jgi:RNA polymerase sigma factor (sigma-70 family)
MSDKGLRTVVQQTRQFVAVEAAGALCDHALLERFVRSHDEAAFAALVERHAAMVLGVCRRVLRHGQDAEDASQATFLVLARRAASIRMRTAVASWLYGVAYRIARKLRIGQQRRRRREAHAGRTPDVGRERDASWREVMAALDEAMMALPDKHRAPLVLCYLQERTRDEAAAQLGLPLSTLRGRLDLGRGLLRSQLSRRGITLSAALLATALAQAAGAATACACVAATVQAALGRSPTSLAARLADSALKSMLPTRALLAVAALVVLGVGAGSTIASRMDRSDGPAAPAPVAPAPLAKQEQEPAQGKGAARRDLHGDPLPPEALARLGTIRFRPGGFLNTLAFTSDGGHIITYAQGSGITIWDARSGKELHRHSPAANAYLSAGLLTPDGQSIVMLEGLDRDACISVRDRTTLNETRRIPAQHLYAPCLTPDGTRLIALADHGKGYSVEVWDLHDGKQLRAWKAHDAYVWAMTLARDGKTLATGGNDKVIRVWDVQTGTLQRELSDHPDIVGQLALSPDGKLLASHGMHELKLDNASVYPWDRRIRIWDVASGKELRQVAMPEKRVGDGWPLGFSALSISPDGRKLATMGLDGLLRVWDIATGKAQQQFSISQSGARALAFAPDGRTIAVGGREICLFDLAAGKQKLPQFGQTLSVSAVAVTPDGRTIVTAAAGQMQFWEATTGKPGKQLSGGDDGIYALHISADGQSLVTESQSRALCLWDLRTRKVRKRIDTPIGRRQLLAVTADAALAALLQSDGSVRLVEVRTGAARGRLPGGKEPVRGAAFASDGGTLITWRGDHSAEVWDVASVTRTRQLALADARRAIPPGPARSFGHFTAAVSPTADSSRMLPTRRPSSSRRLPPAGRCTSWRTR